MIEKILAISRPIGLFSLALIGFLTLTAGGGGGGFGLKSHPMQTGNGGIQPKNGNIVLNFSEAKYPNGNRAYPFGTVGSSAKTNNQNFYCKVNVKNLNTSKTEVYYITSSNGSYGLTISNFLYNYEYEISIEFSDMCSIRNDLYQLTKGKPARTNYKGKATSRQFGGKTTTIDMTYTAYEICN